MEIELIIVTLVNLDDEISMEEFEANWSAQVPHWNLLTNECISFFKGKRYKQWKNKDMTSSSRGTH